jgi:hypothetical protein
MANVTRRGKLEIGVPYLAFPVEGKELSWSSLGFFSAACSNIFKEDEK